MSLSGKSKVAVLGGGVCGLTAAKLLQSCGVQTTLYAEKHPFDAGVEADPLVPTFYAAAILYPDKLPLTGAKEVVAASCRVFALCSAELPDSGVFAVKHYVMSENPVRIQDFPDLVAPIVPLADAALPRYRAERALHGYCYSTQLAELPIYIPWMRKRFLSLGGAIVQRTISADNLDRIEADLIINCLGYGAEKVFPYLDGTGELLRGSLLYIKGQGLLYNDRGERISYEYLPPESVYTKEESGGMYVYAYPRTDGLILGGVREAGQMVDGSFVPRWEFGERIGSGELTLPKPVLEVNRRVISEQFGVDLELENAEIRVGYRYSISEENGGVRLGLASSQAGRVPVMHCVGLGASGVTYSWGCALKLLSDAVRAGILTKPRSCAGADSLAAVLEDELARDFSF